ncbi:hypothetical protein ACTNEW_03300 [Blautia sp. HCP3S3_G3]|uniref:hypothetical protein n=1 Tax=Blautia sp. HCP3S3_G3 TaxID=3438913 RepID=UPI003F88B7B3
MNVLFEYLRETYGENEPIFVSDIEYNGMSDNYIRQQVKKLTDAGLLKRYDTGIYFIPKKSIFKSGTQLSMNRVIERKYLQDKNERCGYVSGVAFANQLGITTQVSMICEVVTNKATNDRREITLANSRVIIRRPRTPVNEQNYRILQFLDLMKDIDYFAEVTGEELQKCLCAYLEANSIRFADLEKYLGYYPDKIYRNLFETRLLYGIPS